MEDPGRIDSPRPVGPGNVAARSETQQKPSPSPKVIAEIPSNEPTVGNNCPQTDAETGAEKIHKILAKFKPFTKLSLTTLKARILERKRSDEEKKEHEMEDAHLKDGQLVVDEDMVEKDPKLAAGKCLPKAVAKHFPKQHLGLPIEDIDPWYSEYEETFMVVTRRFNKFGYIVRFSASPSLYIFPPWNPIRKLALYTYVHPLFDLIVIFTILANSLYMAMNIDENVPEYTFLAIYTFEAIVKTIARGLILRNHTYLRDPWNWLDFVVLVSAYATIIAQFAGGATVNIAALRTFRVFRVLKTVAVIPGLKRIIEALLRALRMLGDVYLMTFFFFTIFALFGVEIFMGTLKTKCVRDASVYGLGFDKNFTNNYTDWDHWITNSSNWNLRDDGYDYQVCGNASGAQSCPVNYTCLRVDASPNPHYDFTNFDNFYSSFMVSIQIFNTDYWDFLYNLVIAANGYGAFIWFIVGIVLLSYYLANLFQAVVAMSYQVEEEEDDDAPDKTLEITANKKPKMRFVFDPFRLRNLSPEKLDRLKDARSKSLLSVRFVTEKRLGMRKASASTLSNKGSIKEFDDDATIVGDVNKIGKTNAEVEALHPESAKDDIADLKEDTSKSETMSVIKEEPEPSKFFRWPAFANRHRYKVRDRPPSAISSEDLSKIGYWDRNPLCCLSCCVGYFPWLRVQHVLMIIVTDPFFELFITATIVVNTIAMASYHYGMTDELRFFLDTVNDVCTYIFLTECTLKLMAMCGEYFANRWNWLDFAVVIGSIVDIVFTQANISFAGFNTSIIRLLRLLRILKLAKSWKTMRTLLEIIFGTIGAIGNLMLVLLIVIFIFAVIGMQLFGQTYNEHKFMPGIGKPSFTTINGFFGQPEWNWNDFFHSFMMVFRVLCRETYQPMWDCITANSAEICVPFYLAILMIGSYVVLNLFMAVLLNAFSSENLSKRKKGDEDDRLRKRLKRIQASIKHGIAKCFAKCCARRVNPALPLPANQGDEIASTYFGGGEVQDELDVSQGHAVMKVKLNVPKEENEHDRHRKVRHHHQNKTNTTSASSTTETQLHTKSTSVTEGTETRFATRRSTGGGSVAGVSTLGSSLGDDVRLRDCCWPFIQKRLPGVFRLFSVESRFGSLFHKARYNALKISEHKAFEYTILGFIFASSISLCIQDSNLIENSELDVALNYLDYIYLGVFTIEMLLKLFAIGIRGYFTSFWTLLDFFIVATGYADLIMAQVSSSSNLTALRSLRTLRALRPLRAISRWQGMRIVVNALISAIPPIANVLLVVMIIWLIFAIMGVQFFAGKFWYCLDVATGNRIPAALVPDRKTCEEDKRRAWGNYIINFDNIGNAYLALLQIATFEGWTVLLQMAIDSANEIGQQPSPENNINYYVFFVIFAVVCSFFLLNLFVGVIIDGFNALKKQYEGNSALQLFMTDTQKQYYKTIKKLGSRKPKKTVAKPTNRFGVFMFEIANSARFEAALAFCIALNVVILATTHYNQPFIYTFMQEMLDLAFTTIFALEILVMLIAFRQYYFKNAWHIFDFIVIILSLVSYGIQDLLEALSISPTVLHSLRLLRVGRVLRLIRASKGVRKLMFSFVMSLPALFNICCLLFLIIFIYAIIGMNLFGRVGHFGGNLDDIYNFHTFANALMTLFRLTTVSGWDNVHQGLSFSDDPQTGCQMNVSLSDPNYIWSNPCCNRTAWKRPNGDIVYDAGGTGNCGNFTLATLYCVSYLLWSGFIIVNMFAAVILDNYQQAVEQEETGVTDDDIEGFYHVWEHYDPAATQFIPLEELQHFAASLEPPLACPKPNEHALTILDIPILKDSATGLEVVHCLDVLIAFIRKALGYLDETDDFVQVRETLESMFKVAFPSRVQVERISSTKLRKKQDIAARTLQKAWRNYRMEKSWRQAAKKKNDVSVSHDTRSSTPLTNISTLKPK